MRGSHAGIGNGVCRRAGYGAAILVALVLCLSGAVLSDDIIAITGIDVRVVSGTGASSALSDQAGVGDLLHVRANVANVGAQTVERLEIEFFFTEQITGEHGKIGTQTVYEILAGGEKRPVVTLDTTGFTPGIYRFTAALLDPDSALNDDVTENNRYEQRLAEATAMLASGARIGELSVLTTFGLCQLGSTASRNLFGTTRVELQGGITDSINLSVYNVGRVPLTNAVAGEDHDPIAVAVQYRNSNEPTVAWEPLGSYAPDGSDNTLEVRFDDIAPGDSKELLLKILDFSALEPVYRPTTDQQATFSVLGRPAGSRDRLFVRVVLTAGSGDTAVSQEIFLPSETSGATIYGEPDLWTFPVRSECGCEESCDRVSTAIAPVLLPGDTFLFHVTTDGTGSELNVLNVTSGASVADWSTDQEIVTRPALSWERFEVPNPDPNSMGLLEVQEWTVYLGTDDGALHSLLVTRTEDGAVTLVERPGWAAPDGLVSGLDREDKTTTHLVLTDTGVRSEALDEVELIVTSESGAFFLNASSGASISEFTRRTDIAIVDDAGFADTEPLSISLAPVYVAGMLWFAVDQYVVGLDGTAHNGCAYAVDDVVTTPLALAGDASTIFLGTAFGTIYALTAGSVVPTDPDDAGPPICPTLLSIDTTLRSVVGIATGEDEPRAGDTDIRVYAVDEDFSVWSIEYQPGDGFQPSTRIGPTQVRASGSQGAMVPWTSKTSPALAETNRGVETVFLAGMFRDQTEGGTTVTRPALYALTSDLERIKSFDAWGEMPEFVFKLEVSGLPFLTPLLYEEKSWVIVTVPGGYLYTFDGSL